MAHAPLHPGSPAATHTVTNASLDALAVPVIDPHAILTVDELKAHATLCHDALQRLYVRQERPQSQLVRRLLRNMRIITTKIEEGRCEL